MAANRQRITPRQSQAYEQSSSGAAEKLTEVTQALVWVGYMEILL